MRSVASLLNLARLLLALCVLPTSAHSLTAMLATITITQPWRPRRYVPCRRRLFVWLLSQVGFFQPLIRLHLLQVGLLLFLQPVLGFLPGLCLPP